MSLIRDDTAFKQAIDAMPLAQQRVLGARFVNDVFDLTDDFRLKRALKCAESSTASDAELLEAYRDAKSAEVETYTACGHMVDWRTMATHYVASAIAACVAPTATLVPGIDSPAYDAAMASRMAKNCERLADGDHGECREMDRQYEIIRDFLDSA